MHIEHQWSFLEELQLGFRRMRNDIKRNQVSLCPKSSKFFQRLFQNNLRADPKNLGPSMSFFIGIYQLKFTRKFFNNMDINIDKKQQ